MLIGLGKILAQRSNKGVAVGADRAYVGAASDGYESSGRRWAAEDGTRLITLQDVVVSLQLMALAPNALFKRQEAWPGEARKFADAISKMFGSQLSDFSSMLPGVLMRLTGRDCDSLTPELYAAYALECIEVLAARLGRFNPASVRLVGADKLAEARQQGYGAVLWVEKAFSGSLLVKAALSQAGYPLHHHSATGHGFSGSKLGIRFLNEIYVGAEMRYLAERLVDTDGRQMATSRRIIELLNQNEFVSITVADTGTRLTQAPVLDGVIHLATGAPHFALRTGAALLPVFCYRDGGEYVVEIGERIQLEGKRRDEAFQYATDDFARQTSAYIQAHPLDWAGWFGGTYSEPA